MSPNPQEAPEAAPPTQNGPEEAPEAVAPAVEPRLPTRKDTSLREFLNKMDDYAPIVRAQLGPSSRNQTRP